MWVEPALYSRHGALSVPWLQRHPLPSHSGTGLAVSSVMTACPAPRCALLQDCRSSPLTSTPLVLLCLA